MKEGEREEGREERERMIKRMRNEGEEEVSGTEEKLPCTLYLNFLYS